MENIILATIIFLIGLIIGSFSNVCIYRIPLNESITYPGSHCPKCNQPIKYFDNIPVLSYLFLKGKCRYCKNKIPIQYPIVELLTGLIYLALYLLNGISLITFAYMILCSVLIIISFIDLKEKIIPDVLSLPFMVIGFILSFFLKGLSFTDSLLGILIGGGSLLIIAIIGSKVFKKEAMGGGDIKLAAMIGAFLGWKLTLLSLFFGFFLGAVIGVIILTLNKGKSDNVPFGPFISFGAIVAIFWGEKIINWYLMI